MTKFIALTEIQDEQAITFKPFMLNIDYLIRFESNEMYDGCTVMWVKNIDIEPMLIYVKETITVVLNRIVEAQNGN